jgi:HAE1 family hydrophobic/amphiphilic exporter-1
MVSRLPEGSSQQRSKDVAVKINEILKKTPGVDFWVHIGGLSILDGANVSNISATFIVYKDWKDRGSSLNQDVIISSINRELFGMQEAQAFVVIPPPIRGLGAIGGFQMIVEDRGGLGLIELKRATDELVISVNSESNLRGLATIFSVSSPQLYLEIQRTKAQALQVPMTNVFDTLQAYLGSSFVNLFNKYNQVFQVYIQPDDRYRMQPRDIRNLYTRNQLGEMVPLGSFVDVKAVQGPELIARYNLYPAAAIFGSASPGYSSGQALSLMEKMAGEKLPDGLSYEWTSTSYQEKKVGSQAYVIYALSIIFVYMVLAALYESWTSPAAVIFVVPMALVGVLLALIVCGYDNKNW